MVKSLRRGAFILEALNSLATTWYFYYLFFFMEARFGFKDLENLFLAAGMGFITIFAAYFAGRFGQRKGYLNALLLGFAIMAGSLVAGLLFDSIFSQLIVAGICTVGMGLTWPNLEALVSVNSSRDELPRTIGIYNLIWSGVGALAFCSGGALLEHLGLYCIFWIPIVIHAFQFAFTLYLKRFACPQSSQVKPVPGVAEEAPVAATVSAESKLFLRLSWLANPFAYIAVTTIVPVIPGLARKLELSPTLAGVFCSIIFFSRTAAFYFFWKWAGWHYRWRWLVCSYTLVIVTFAAVLLAGNLWVLIVAQIFLGIAIGLIYYSSLFYSMDTGDSHGDHGGVHEAAIGLGNFIGPGAGAAALHYSSNPQSGLWTVTALLIVGLVGMFFVHQKGSRK